MIHTISRNMNEMLEAVTKWLPIYMTGMIEPYFYPKLRDGVFQRTLFIAPKTAAIISSSVQQNTGGMLNLLITNRAAIDALTLEYENYFSICRPLMRVFKSNDSEEFRKTVNHLSDAEGAALLQYAMPPLFSMPEDLILELSKQTENEVLPVLWKKSFAAFRNQIKVQSLYLMLLDPAIMQVTQNVFLPPLADIFELGNLTYSRDQYLKHINHLLELEKKYENLKVNFRADVYGNMMLYVKDDVGVIMTKANNPATAFVTHDRNMTNAFWDYLMKL